LKLGLGRYGVISAFGRKEVENFSFTPSLSGTYNENIVIENVLDTMNDQNVAVKANVRKTPTFTLDPQIVDFGIVDPALPPPEKSGFTLTNVSKHERTFVIGIKSDSSPSKGGSSSSSSTVVPSEPRRCFVDISLSRDDVGTALSKTEEEEIENIQQKLKIAKRKGKKDKIQKYEARLTELGIPLPQDAEADTDDNESTTTNEIVPPTPGTVSGDQLEEEENVEYGPKALISTLTVILQPNQKNRIFVELLPKSPHGNEEGGSNNESNTKEHNSIALDLDSVIEVHEKKNADESQTVRVIARQRIRPDITSAAMASHNASRPGVGGNHSSVASGTSSVQSVLPTSQGTFSLFIEELVLMLMIDILHIALMRYCLELTQQCVVSPTAFCVASCLFLPATSPHYTALSAHFQPFTIPSTTSSSSSSSSPSGLILADGYSRQIPGNTHAEANALTNFQSRLLQLHSSAEGRALPSKEEILKDTDCYATMEPCSVRTSGGPSCALELVKAGVRGVWLGVEEPPDFVQCQGVNILLEGGVKVGRVAGLEEDCLKAARRGRD
jgi:pyrimidine deaminase RibD-like protein